MKNLDLDVGKNSQTKRRIECKALSWEQFHKNNRLSVFAALQRPNIMGKLTLEHRNCKLTKPNEANNFGSRHGTHGSLQLQSSCFQYVRKPQPRCSPQTRLAPLPLVYMIRKLKVPRNTFHEYFLKNLSSQCKIPKYLSVMKDYSKDFQSISTKTCR